MELQIKTNIEDEYILLRVESILLIENITPLKTLLKKYVDENKHVLLDISGITFIDSTSLAILVKFKIELDAINKHLALINVTNDIMRLFKTTKLDKHIYIFDDVPAAMSGLGLMA